MDQNHVSEMLAACEKRREQRRQFLKMAGSTTAVVAGASVLAACGSDGPTLATPTPTPVPTPTPAPTPAPTGGTPSEGDVLNFALNLEYLEAQFYSFAAFDTGLPASQLTGSGVAGAATGGRRVNFTDPLVAAYAREIARDEIAHVAFLRSALAGSVVAQPAIDISASANGPFSTAARAAGLITGANSTFDPYANDENFLLAAFLFEDVGVTAYKGGIRFLTSATLEAAAGIHAAESYHAGLVRTVLYRKGLSTESLIAATEAISNARDSLDGTSDIDQGVRGTTSGTGAAATPKSNIVPTDANGIAYSRTPGQVLNIVYLNSAAVTGGGFFPNGVNGTLRTSGTPAANG